MLRLTLLLCIGMFAALMIAGEDRGQMRPGLVAAAAKKVQPEAVTGAESQQVAAATGTEAETETTLALADPEVEQPAPQEPVPDLGVADLSASAEVAPTEPAPYVEPERQLVTAVEEPVFSLSSIGNETPPVAPGTPGPEVAAGGEGTIWYVNASSVNVRAEPSTEAEVVGRLASGEATLMVQAVNDDWARIVIQGDGVEGFVAMRYLSAEAP